MGAKFPLLNDNELLLFIAQIPSDIGHRTLITIHQLI